ncbi:hypothetical protein CNY89_03895, partial [Amaricoccus sp. HAR-UPW-R2A-40]
MTRERGGSRRIHISRSAAIAAIPPCRAERRASAVRPALARSASKVVSMRFTASSAIGETGGACSPRLAEAAISASSKNLR